MKRSLVLLLLLTSCATGGYIPVDPNTSNDTHDEYMACVRPAIHEYYQGGPNAAYSLAGGLGGAVGGAIMGATSDLPNDAGMKPSDIDLRVKKCMEDKGYVSTK